MIPTPMLHLRRRVRTFATLASLGLVPVLVAACGGSSTTTTGDGTTRKPGVTDYVSAQPPGQGGSFGGGAGGAPASDSGNSAPPTAGGSKSGATDRKVEETDLYALDGDRLFYLNAYRGLMVFDVADVDHPKLLGRSPIFGSPVEMTVHGGIAVVVVADWYGTMDDGSPFHGSIVRGIDARDPAAIKITGEAKLGGWVRDTRVVGDVLYAVSEDYGWSYGWGYGGDVVAAPAGGAGGGVSSGTTNGPKIAVSSVSFAGGVIKQAGYQAFDGYSGIFNVTKDAIMLAKNHVQNVQTGSEPGLTDLQYVDITDPAGAIKLRGTLTVKGSVNGWGTDNGRWNLDFADGKTAHTIGCALTYCGSPQDGYVLSTADFTDPDHPKTISEAPIAATGWQIAARFDSGRMYLSPSNYYYSPNSGTTPFQIYDLSDPAAPKLASSTDLTGTVWSFIPSGNQIFALGSDYTQADSGQSVTLRYVDVTDATKPTVLGTSSFGQGWAWTPAAGTFKAFTKDETQKLVALPFSGWDSKSYGYNNGVQLISFANSTLKTLGASRSKGWVERGIFVTKGATTRLVSLSDLALSVVDYTDPMAPKVVNEMTLARNIVNADPNGGTIAELSTDWWGNDQTKSELRVLPIANAEETTDLGNGTSVTINGVNAQVFHNGDLAYVVSSVRHDVPCATGDGGTGGTPAPTPVDGKGGAGTCSAWTQEVQVVDLANGGAKLRGKIDLPDNPGYYGYYGYGGYYGCWYYDWYNGADAVQVGSDALAFRRWVPSYDPNGVYTDAKNALYVVDLKDADHPAIASTTITSDPTGWWGNMRAVGDTLYTTHYEWMQKPTNENPYAGYVKYYLDRIDLSDRHAPKIGTKINVPGVLVGGSSTDPSILYTIDYRWDGDKTRNDLAVVKIDGDLAYFQGSVALDGWVGNVVVQNDRAYMSAQVYDWAKTGPGQATVSLHEVDLRDPSHPNDRASTAKNGWGWLLGVEGDRAIVTSGWSSGVDIYKLSETAPPAYDKYVRTLGWWSSSLARQGSSLFLASGYWGVQRIDL